MASKKIRPFTPAWRWLIGLSSVGAFLGGWTVLAHAPNPYETVAASRTVVQGTTLPTINTNSSSSQRTSPVVPLPTAVVEETVPQVQPTTPTVQTQTRSTTRTGRQPRVRTGGS